MINLPWFLTPAVGVSSGSLGWARTPMTKPALYSIYFFLFGPEKSHFSKPILTLGEQRFWNTNNTIKNFKSFSGWGILFYILFCFLFKYEQVNLNDSMAFPFFSESPFILTAV